MANAPKFSSDLLVKSPSSSRIIRLPCCEGFARNSGKYQPGHVVGSLPIGRRPHSTQALVCTGPKQGATSSRPSLISGWSRCHCGRGNLRHQGGLPVLDPPPPTRLRKYRASPTRPGECSRRPSPRSNLSPRPGGGMGGLEPISREDDCAGRDVRPTPITGSFQCRRCTRYRQAVHQSGPIR